MGFNYDELPEDVQHWYDTRPECVQKRILEYPPGETFVLKSTGSVVRVFSYTTEEDDTICDECQILILQEDNDGKLHHERRVFGVDLKDLLPVPEGYEPPGDLPLEEMEPEFRAKVEELLRSETS